MTRIILKSYNYKVLEIFLKYLKVSTNMASDFKIIYLPTKVRKITLLRSPHVYKKSKDQYQETVYKALVEFNGSNSLNLKLISLISNAPKNISLKVSFK